MPAEPASAWFTRSVRLSAMDAAGWSAVFAGFSAVIAVFAAIIAGTQARQAREQVETATRQAEAAEEQARTAREALREAREAREAAQEQARLARDSAGAALDQADSARESVLVARAALDQGDRPDIEAAVGRRQNDRLPVKLTMRDGPAAVNLAVEWSSTVAPFRPRGAQSVEPDVEHGSETFEIVKNETVQFEVAAPGNVHHVSIRLAMHCVDTADSTRRWPLTDVVSWKPSRVHVY